MRIQSDSNTISVPEDRSPRRPKVFGIGFQKTGTTSLGLALEILGYRIQGVLDFWDSDIATTIEEDALDLVEDVDAVQDNPWPLLYQELDARYPGSKFILTVRPTDRWIRSVVRHFGRRSTPMREWVYGAGRPRGNESLYVSRYERHNRDVQAYFASRADDLLVMDVSAGDGWNVLCPFLDVEMQPIPFPRANDRHSRRWNRIRRYLRRPVPALRRLVQSYWG
jgi:hypothetical protein